MTYILSAERDTDVVDAFDRYRTYLAENADRFPPGAYALATSRWYFNFSDHRAPHDAWLEELSISETGTGGRVEKRGVEIRIRLLGAYHDGHVELRYRDVVRYRCEVNHARLNEGTTHGDWRYDEFRLIGRRPAGARDRVVGHGSDGNVAHRGRGRRIHLDSEVVTAN